MQQVDFRTAAKYGRLLIFLFPELARVLCLNVFEHQQGVLPMEWTTPQHEEIDLNCEISSYANAEL